MSSRAQIGDFVAHDAIDQVYADALLDDVPASKPMQIPTSLSLSRRRSIEVAQSSSDVLPMFLRASPVSITPAAESLNASKPLIARQFSQSSESLKVVSSEALLSARSALDSDAGSVCSDRLSLMSDELGGSFSHRSFESSRSIPLAKKVTKLKALSRQSSHVSLMSQASSAVSEDIVNSARLASAVHVHSVSQNSAPSLSIEPASSDVASALSSMIGSFIAREQRADEPDTALFISEHVPHSLLDEASAAVVDDEDVQFNAVLAEVDQTLQAAPGSPSNASALQLWSEFARQYRIDRRARMRHDAECAAQIKYLDDALSRALSDYRLAASVAAVAQLECDRLRDEIAQSKISQNAALRRAQSLSSPVQVPVVEVVRAHVQTVDRGVCTDLAGLEYEFDLVQHYVEEPHYSPIESWSPRDAPVDIPDFSAMPTSVFSLPMASFSSPLSSSTALYLQSQGDDAVPAIGVSLFDDVEDSDLLDSDSDYDSSSMDDDDDDSQYEIAEIDAELSRDELTKKLLNYDAAQESEHLTSDLANSDPILQSESTSIPETRLEQVSVFDKQLMSSVSAQAPAKGAVINVESSSSTVASLPLESQVTGITLSSASSHSDPPSLVNQPVSDGATETSALDTSGSRRPKSNSKTKKNPLALTSSSIFRILFGSPAGLPAADFQSENLPDSHAGAVPSVPVPEVVQKTPSKPVPGSANKTPFSLFKSRTDKHAASTTSLPPYLAVPKPVQASTPVLQSHSDQTPSNPVSLPVAAIEAVIATEDPVSDRTTYAPRGRPSPTPESTTSLLSPSLSMSRTKSEKRLPTWSHSKSIAQRLLKSASGMLHTFTAPAVTRRPSGDDSSDDAGSDSSDSDAEGALMALPSPQPTVVPDGSILSPARPRPLNVPPLQLKNIGTPPVISPTQPAARASNPLPVFDDSSTGADIEGAAASSPGSRGPAAAAAAQGRMSRSSPLVKLWTPGQSR